MLSVTDQFLNLFKWYCKDADLTLDELIGHLANRVTEPDEWRTIRYAIYVDDPVQLEAENALASLVQCMPKRHQTIRRWTAEPGRDVDWAQTFLASKSSRPGEFCTLVRTQVPDLHLLQALAGLASRWRRILEVVPHAANKSFREARLREVGAALHPRQIPWSLATARQLQRVDRFAASKIESAMQMWEGPGSRGDALAKRFEQWLNRDQGHGLKALNEDTLFEWTVALAIAKTAVAEERWSLAKTRFAGNETKYGEILLSQEDWRLRISKGKPRDIDGNILNRHCDDLITNAQKQAGLNPTGFQPDVVLSFFQQNIPKSLVTFLADAKRNDEGNGRNYISPSIQKAAVYVLALEKFLYCKPYCTLFFQQGIDKVANINSKTQDHLTTLVNKLANSVDAFTFPEILCLDSRMMYQEHLVLKHWLAHLFEAAKKHVQTPQHYTSDQQ